MRYIDQQGKSITKDQWESIFRSAQGTIECSRVGGYIVDTSWVGLAADNEKVPMIFLTRVLLAADGDRKYNHQNSYKDKWTHTEQAAKMTHADVVRGISKDIDLAITQVNV